MDLCQMNSFPARRLALILLFAGIFYAPCAFAQAQDVSTGEEVAIAFFKTADTNPDFDVLTHGASQVKAAIDATIALGGENYVFWGGREGYMSLINTDMKREQEHLAKFLHAAKDYARK